MSLFAGGLIIAGTNDDKTAETQIGDVLAIGNGVDCGIQVGDVIMFGRFGGTTELEVADGEVCFVAQTTIMAKLS